MLDFVHVLGVLGRIYLRLNGFFYSIPVRVEGQQKFDECLGNCEALRGETSPAR